MIFRLLNVPQFLYTHDLLQKLLVNSFNWFLNFNLEHQGWSVWSLRGNVDSLFWSNKLSRLCNENLDPDIMIKSSIIWWSNPVRDLCLVLCEVTAVSGHCEQLGAIRPGVTAATTTDCDDVPDQDFNQSQTKLGSERFVSSPGNILISVKILKTIWCCRQPAASRNKETQLSSSY